MRKFFKKYTPNREMVKEYKFLNFLGNSLFHEDLWRFNRLSFCRATVIGVFWGWMPMFFQMIPAAYCAVLFRANLPLSVSSEWIFSAFENIWQPLLVGTLIIGIISSILGYFIMHMLWRFYAYNRLQRSKK